jgi:type I restriction-modification system DNA methylase subunit
MTQELEKTLWATSDKLRNNMDAAEYKHMVQILVPRSLSNLPKKDLILNLDMKSV